MVRLVARACPALVAALLLAAPAPAQDGPSRDGPRVGLVEPVAEVKATRGVVPEEVDVLAERLERLQRLRDAGLLTPDELEALRRGLTERCAGQVLIDGRFVACPLDRALLAVADACVGAGGALGVVLRERDRALLGELRVTASFARIAPRPLLEALVSGIEDEAGRSWSLEWSEVGSVFTVRIYRYDEGCGELPAPEAPDEGEGEAPEEGVEPDEEAPQDGWVGPRGPGAPWLGVRCVGPGVGPPDGPPVPELRVTEVAAGSGAAEAGVEAGDDIVALGEVEVRTAEELRRALEAHAPGRLVSVTVLRRGERREIAVLLLRRP